MSATKEVPGTVRLFADSGELLQTKVELVPKPSHHAEDPLNWSRTRNFTFIGAISTSVLFSIYTQLAEETNLTLDQLVAGSGYSYWAIGFSNIFFQPLSLAIGKRPVLVLCNLAGALLTIWTVYNSGNATWIVSRLLIGLTSGPSFCLIEVVIADVRALPLGLYVCVLYTGAVIGPLIGGFVFEGLGWKGVIWLSVGLQVLTTIVMICFFEETNFSRKEPTIALQVMPDLNPYNAAKHLSPISPDETKNDTTHQIQVEPVLPNEHRPVWGKPKFRHFFTVSPYAAHIMKRGLIQPFLMMRLPLVWWCGVMYGIYQVYFNLFGSLSSGVLAFPPYDFSTSAIGLTFLGPLLSGVPSAVLSGWLCDAFSLKQARKNYGISEPEHKLKLYIVPAVLTPIGLIMMGLGPYYGAHWLVYVAGEFVLNLAGPVATLLIITYAFDSFHSIDPDDSQGPKAAAQDSAPYFSAIILIAMSITFAFGYATTPWTFGWSFKLFAITAAIGGTILNATVLLIMRYGKRLRADGEQYYRKVINW
ncbi:uncharacterized protein IL334_005788 [Kwoniella shivajii]|uniref:Major facilitator superfamily (MFS) profile domain-containing protein n=1 Tax=Kwoniella shivajii TaxID=564305 RepID=A0ABZ1D4F6_9TREE|nr:hypothetical protein IL334_005788 [Kwoniella shivajii]